MTMILDFLRQYAVLIRILAAVLAVIAAVAWWQHFKEVQQNIGYQRAAGEYAVKLAEAKDAALVIERGWKTKWERAINHATELENERQAAAAAGAVSAGRLQRTIDDLRRGLANATAEACRKTAGAALAVFDECAERYRSLAAAADGHAADATTCAAAWPE